MIMNNVRLRIPTLARCLPPQAIELLDSDITISVFTGEFTMDLTGTHYNCDMFVDSQPGLYQSVQSPVMSLEQWFSYWPGSDTHTDYWMSLVVGDRQWFNYSFPHNFHMSDVIYEPRKLIDVLITGEYQ